MTESENPASDENPTPVDSSASKTSIIRLDDFLKRHGLVGTGGEAKIRIQTGEVTVNGEVETRRRKQLSPGDVVEAVGETITVTPDCFD